MTMNTNAAPASILNRAKRGLKSIAPVLLIAVAAVGFSATLVPNAPLSHAWDLPGSSDCNSEKDAVDAATAAKNKAQSEFDTAQAEFETAQAEYEKSLNDFFFYMCSWSALRAAYFSKMDKQAALNAKQAALNAANANLTAAQQALRNCRGW